MAGKELSPDMKYSIIQELIKNLQRWLRDEDVDQAFDHTIERCDYLSLDYKD
jgi:hypothetical protein